MPKVKETNNSKQMLERVLGKGDLLHHWRDGDLVQPLWKSVRRILKRLKVNLTDSPAVALLSIYSKDLTAYFMGTYLLRHVQCHSTDKSWETKATYVSVLQLIQGHENVAHVYSELVQFCCKGNRN